jgi:hypothetical protein
MSLRAPPVSHQATQARGDHRRTRSAAGYGRSLNQTDVAPGSIAMNCIGMAEGGGAAPAEAECHGQGLRLRLAVAVHGHDFLTLTFPTLI